LCHLVRLMLSALGAGAIRLALLWNIHHFYIYTLYIYKECELKRESMIWMYTYIGCKQREREATIEMTVLHQYGSAFFQTDLTHSKVESVLLQKV
jgi:hypothetical protein